MANVNRICVAALAMGALTTTSLRAATVWSDDFSDDTAGGSPQRNFAVPTGNDWSIGVAAGITQNVSNATGSNAFSALDTSTANSSSSFVNFGRFGTFDTSLPAHSVFTATFDVRIDSFVASSNVSTFRVTVQDQYNNGTNRARAMTIGLGYANIDGVAGNELFLMADAKDDTLSSASTISPLGTTAIGWNGTSFDSNFNLGQYASGNADANDTNDEYYRFSLTFVDGSRTVVGTATRLSNGASVDFTRTLAGVVTDPGFSFKGGTLAGAAPSDAFSIILPQGGTGQAYVDNINFETASVAVPEPTALAMTTIGAIGLLARRRRHC